MVDRTATTKSAGVGRTSTSAHRSSADLRLIGTYNSTNVQFPVVEMEVYGALLTPPSAILTSTNLVMVPEGGMAEFQVKLNTEPISPTTVTVSQEWVVRILSAQSGTSLVFNASNCESQTKQ